MPVCAYRNACVHRLIGLSHKVKNMGGGGFFCVFFNLAIGRREEYKCNKE